MNPGDHIAYFETRVFDIDHGSVKGARPPECQKVSSRFQHAQAFLPYFHAWHIVVPFFPHERQAVGRIGHDRVNAIGFHFSHYFEAIAVNYFHFRPFFIPIIARGIPKLPVTTMSLNIAVSGSAAKTAFAMLVSVGVPSA